MNLPTKITVARIAVIPLMFVAFCLREIFEYYYVVVAAIFIISACTDFVDGYLARRNNQVTDLGKFLDPIADKILVVAGLVIIIADCAAIGVNVYFMVIATAVILAREFIIGVFRQIAAAKGKVLQADAMGKIKTIATLVGIPGLLLGPLQNNLNVGAHYAGLVFFYIGYVAFAFATLMTIVSGFNYIYKSRRVFSSSANGDNMSDNGGDNAAKDIGEGKEDEK